MLTAVLLLTLTNTILQLVAVYQRHVSIAEQRRANIHREVSVAAAETPPFLRTVSPASLRTMQLHGRRVTV